MRFLLRTLSWSYLRHHPGKTLLAVAGIAMGVAIFVAVKVAQGSLVTGFRTTIDRLAGLAQIQVTGAAGVPEALRDALRDLPGIAVAEPVIEQVVQPEPSSLGSLLVFAVDLVGDRRLRSYSFSGDDADVDDPLVFLAQPDSVALSREFANRAGLRSGDVLVVRAAGTVRRLTVRALLEPQGFARGYGGNVAVTDVYAAQDLFGRGRRFDRIDIRLDESVSLDAGLDMVTRLVGTGYDVDTPERRSRHVEQLVTAFTGTFDVVSYVALGIGTYLIFNVFTVGVHRRRRDIGILRTIGVTPRQIGGLFLVEAALLGAAGAVAGLAVGVLMGGRVMGAMTTALETTQGLSDAGVPVLTAGLFGRALVVSVVGSLIGAWWPAREAARVPPVTALATGPFQARVRPLPRWRLAGGALLLIFAFIVTRFGLISGPAMLPLVAVACAIGASVLSGRAVAGAIAPLRPLLFRLARVSGRLAGDSLMGQPRRTAGTAAILAVSMAFVLGTAGYLQAIRVAFDRWIDQAMTADLFVRASTGLGPSDVRLPDAVRAAIVETPGVAFADGFRQERVAFRNQPIALVALDATGFVERSGHEFVAGDTRAFRDAIVFGRGVVVSDNFARRFHVGLGDVIRLESPTGPIALPVAAVVVNFISDRGTVMMGRPVFAEHWQTDRVDAFHVTLAPGASPTEVRDRLRARLDANSPAVISTRAEFVGEMHAALDSLSVLLRAIVTVVMLVALMGVATSLLVTVAERTREFGVLKALGVSPAQIGGSVVLHAVTLALVSLAVAVPLGDLLAWLFRARVSENFAGFRFPRSFPIGPLWQVALALPFVAALASWVPARWAVQLNTARAIAHE